MQLSAHRRRSRAGRGTGRRPAVPVSADQAPPVNVPGIDKPVIVVTGEVTGTETWVNTNYYVLRGAVFVRSGRDAEHPGGHTVIGESGSVGTLIVERGGRLMAIGTARAPIVFTSDQPIGTRGRGDWGGLIINGRAPVNLGRRRGRGRRRHGRLRRHRRRTTTAASCVTCASSSPASSSARTTS